jgi:sulfonate transport system ATP-binding protein
VVFQDARLLPWSSVIDNVTLGLPGRTARPRALELLREVGLADRAHAWPKELSGGESQRACLARALMREPQLMLMDEPFGALDALTRIRMHALLKALLARHGAGVLLVTHDVEEALLLADRVVVLSEGLISFDVAVNLDGPVARRQSPHFAELRSQLLSELGVAEDDL